MPPNHNLCSKKIRFPLASHLQLLSPYDTCRLLDSSATNTASSTIFKNYFLYDNNFDYSTLTHSSEPEPDFATIFASHRFFLTSPGNSNSIIESTTFPTPESSNTAMLASNSYPIDNTNASSYDVCCCDPLCHEHNPLTTVENSVAAPTIFPNPYLDFRRSMQEMVEAVDLIDVKAIWNTCMSSSSVTLH